ncbi:glycerol kinase GlpK [Catenovulum sp. 2E275]|uniref:glycerol kinase GlpK n=1 Tax=Catenovulum sp. 2E275 TaxID=2980497 RepID=UPI0021D3D1ED|nr:glycerol kinase GlpK [Catenovulum sp. 2E275]MCU4675170.1 glycerol kinase GlpK [Catenovulum sp. 2E275]
MTDYILAIDQGTTSSRAIIFDQKGLVVEVAQQEFNQIYPHNGWVEHDPQEIWTSTLAVCQQVINQAQVKIASIGICNQRETTIIWHKKTGKAIYNAIVWQDRRTAADCQNLIEQGYSELINDKTGLLLDPYFSASKIRWILDNVKGARAMAARGELLFGTVDSYLIWKFTQGKQHVTDATNASRTMLFNIKQQKWDDQLLQLFDIPATILPKVLDSADNFGTTETDILGQAIPINGVAGDQQAALFGQNCFYPGMAKSTYGTGAFLMANTGANICHSNNQLLTTVGYRLKGKTCYAIEGSIFIAGAAVSWLKNELKLINTANESDAIASQIDYQHGVYLVPAFTGLGAPYWQPDARGALLGLTRSSGINEIVSATLQSVAYQTRDLQICIRSDGIQIDSIRVDGGMANNAWFMQCLADILQVEVSRPQSVETSALGAAYLAGLGAGIYQSLDEITALYQMQDSFKPAIKVSLRDKLYNKWLKAVESVRQF